MLYGWTGRDYTSPKRKRVKLHGLRLGAKPRSLPSPAHRAGT